MTRIGNKQQPVVRVASCCCVVLVSFLLYRVVKTGHLLASGNYDGGAHQRPILNFRRKQSPKKQDDDSSCESEWVFKILQIADIHLGEAEFKDWGPEQDRKTWIALDAVILMEDPDLIVLAGDQLTANDCKDNATAYYQMLGEFLTKYNTPWAMIFGNHDDTDYVDPWKENHTLPHKYSRSDLLEVDQSFPLSLSQLGPSELFGTTNYVVDINLDGTAAAQVYFLDSGGGSLPQAIEDNQIEWLQKTSNRAKLPAVAFQHIPAPPDGLHSCKGFQDDGIAPIRSDAGILEALSHQDRFSFLAVGHNHGNDYCCQYLKTALHLCFGRHSGHGGYGNWTRGSRIYELGFSQSSDETRSRMKWKTWVRLETGDVVDAIDYTK